MSGNLKVGERIPLLAHLECPEGVTLYVEAVVKKPDRTEIAASPVDLSNEGSGVFFNDANLMPDLQYLTVTYNVFEDISKTMPSDDFCSVTETFYRDEGDSGGEESLASIELDLELKTTNLDLGLETAQADLELSRPMTAIDLKTGQAVLDVQNPSMDLKLNPITLELNLECCE